MNTSEALQKDIETIDLILAVLKSNATSLEAIISNDCYRELEKTQKFKELVGRYQNLEAVGSKLSDIIWAIENIRDDRQKNIDKESSRNISEECSTVRSIAPLELKAMIEEAERQRYFGSQGKKS
jgi:hypothetical protein